MLRSELPCQIGFSFLSVPDLELHFMNVFEQSTSSRRAISSDSVIAGKQWLEPYAAANNVSPDACALLLASAEPSRRAESSDEAMVIDWYGNGSILQSASDEMYEPERRLPKMAKMVPPRMFYKTFWRSVSLRLLQTSECILCSAV